MRRQQIEPTASSIEEQRRPKSELCVRLIMISFFDLPSSVRRSA